jgi:hypothetical protein
MSGEIILTLYHGTSFDVIGGQVLNGQVPLIGKRVLDDRPFSGTLTDNKDFASRWAHKRGPDPILLTYELPSSIIIDEGAIAVESSGHGFVTNLEIAISSLPPSYLSALLYFNYLDESVLKRVVEKRELSFHEIPFKYLVKQEDI